MAVKCIFDDQELEVIRWDQIPKHVGIIMDGNRRWAEDKGMMGFKGHLFGAETLVDIAEAACELGIETLTCYAFSTENWKRTQIEQEFLFELMETYLVKQRDMMIKNGVRLNYIGDISKLPKSCQKIFLETRELTKNGGKLDLVLAVNYGGRDEIRRAILKMIDDVENGQLKKHEISEEKILDYLDTRPFKDPEMIIRTSGEMRMSNFMLYQSSYSEIIVSDTMWPDFKPTNLLQAVLSYQKRIQRSGR
ncbi:MAG: Ditrans,polycis-undecaprenyl-diphosphate synthase ((2E,6E)-farnesyl-diphosphate specific) [Chlamydiae bacterium]|nr:Ditrans,polycis-undecaprenyl-diphosphate synthase ((2E,6E)-farnesyl-diphosphate specific) [Chlamydiota bacterium]